MKAEELEKIVKDMEKTGYEILGIEPCYWYSARDPRKVGAYTVKIAPLNLALEMELEDKRRSERVAKNQPAPDVATGR